MKKHKRSITLGVLLIPLVVIGAFAAEEMSNFDMADKLVGEGKIPMYIRDKGRFVYSPEFSIVGINGINVNLRSQPNINANVILQLSTDDREQWPVYLGEWTHPNGDHWVAGEIRQKGRRKTVWIFGRYAEPMTKETFSEESTTDNDVDLPDDLPDDLPSDVPPERSRKTSVPARKSVSLSSPEEAAEFLEEKLIELEKIMPSETLEYLEKQTEQNGETCWEFSTSFNFRETGRYAVSTSGKIYEYGNDKYSLVTQ